MGRYIDWEFLANMYPVVNRAQSAPEVNSFYIIYAEAEVDARLSNAFTVPFSSNNLTAKELACMGAYLRMGLLRDDQIGAFREEYQARFERILSGDEGMVSITDSGTAVTELVGDTVRSAFASTTEDYHPVFGMGDVVDFEVDSSRLDAEERERM